MEGVDKHADKKQHFVPRVYLKAWETQVETLKEPDRKFKGIYVIKDGKKGEGANRNSVLWKPHLYTINFKYSFICNSCSKVKSQFVDIKYSGDFSHRACMFHKDVEYKRLPSFDSSSQNTDAYNQAKALENVAADFEKQFARQIQFGKTATAKMWEYMQFYKWNTRIFQDKTLLAPMDYTRVQDPNHIFKLPAYTAMAVGLELSLNETQETLRLSGLGFDPNDRTQKAYMYIISTFQGCPIDECNDVLNKLNVPELGTKSRM